jgi:uncharacterized membrane protein YsdA (DUF1294 family)
LGKAKKGCEVLAFGLNYFKLVKLRWNFMEKVLFSALGIYLLAVNLAAFALMGLDKGRAKKNRWRIPEKTLFLPAVLGGALGGVAGMRVFHHKTRHWYFRWGFPALLILQCAAAGWLWWKLGR